MKYRVASSEKLSSLSLLYVECNYPESEVCIKIGKIPTIFVLNYSSSCHEGYNRSTVYV